MTDSGDFASAAQCKICVVTDTIDFGLLHEAKQALTRSLLFVASYLLQFGNFRKENSNTASHCQGSNTKRIRLCAQIIFDP
jgi:hypothetical protein